MNKSNQSDDVRLNRASSIVIGKSLRKTYPLEEHAFIKHRPKGFDSNAILENSNKDRLAKLIPIRYGRMLTSPFTFSLGDLPYSWWMILPGRLIAEFMYKPVEIAIY